ncbi:MAG: thioredoxin domain-containing protein [Gemmatimonadota bacterium]
MNRLASACSAYLRSAAHQPIHWQEWGTEAFERARALDRPVLLDIGAVWCHWCHVMDGESYEDPSLASLLNEHFICIKVDRDERPDVDARYQRAVQALSGQGGWPLTAFLDPSGHVFYGGTYFPPDDRYGRPGFRTVLQQVLDAYHARRDQVQAQALAVRRVVEASLDETAPGDLVPDLLDAAVHQIAEAFEPVHGGFGRAPKFPHATTLLFLLQRWADQKDDRTRQIIETTLRGMAHGGIHDQLGGGFHRYSTDIAWIVPHFEKMSYDNSELLRCYAEASAALGDPLYADVARGIVRWVRETGLDPEGGYLASQDADAGPDDDGDYFTWTVEEAQAVLTPDEFEVAAAYYDIGTAGEMEHHPGKNVLYVADTVDGIAVRQGRDPGAAAALLARARAKLQAARARRQAPFVDRTRYTNWNAMMAGAMLRYAGFLDDPAARNHALLTLRRIQSDNAEPDAVAHAPGGLTGLLDDQVQVAHAATEAYEATGDADWLRWAERIMDRVWRDYRDEDSGGLCDRARGAEGEGHLPSRATPVQDTPTPSPNGTAGVVCARLHELTGERRWRDRLEALLGAFAGRAAELGLYGSAFMLAADWALNPPTHLVIVGPEGGEADRMFARALRTFVPRRVVQRVLPTAEAGSRLPPAVRGMLAAADRRPRAFLCRGTSCAAPAMSDAAWAETLAGVGDALAGG